MTNFLKTFLKEEDGQDIVESQFIACTHRSGCAVCPDHNGTEYY